MPSKYHFGKAIEIMAAKAETSTDAYLVNALFEEGIPKTLGVYLVIFIPVIFCRILSTPFEPKFSQEYIEHNEDGTTKKHLFTENIIYSALWELSENFIFDDPNNGTIFTIAKRSPEFSLINEALLKNLDIKALVFSSVHIVK